MSTTTHNGKDMHKIYTYILKKQLEKYTIEKPEYLIAQRDKKSAVKIYDSRNIICNIENDQDKSKKIKNDNDKKQKNNKNQSENLDKDYMNSLFEYEMDLECNEMNFQCNEATTALGFVYEN